MNLVERLTAAKEAGDYQGLVEAIPYAKFLGLKAELVPGGSTASSTNVDELVTTMTFGPHLIGNPALPALHGGTLGALLESAAIFEVLWRAESIVLPKTITFTVDYLRSAAAIDTHARGLITRQGRRVTNVRIEAWQEDRAKPVATANAILLVMK
ncbi:MAG: PaaI family thioesterase [Kofleriaceae bacterium]